MKGGANADMASRGQKSHRPRLYRIWADMRTRCNNPNFPGYADYGGRGIKVCPEWQAYEPFREWAVSNGYADTLTLDRKDNDKGYSPANCRWVTQKEQCNNKRNNHLLTYNGETLTVAQWARKLGVNYFTLHDRITKLGWSAEKAISTPIKQQKGEK